MPEMGARPWLILLTVLAGVLVLEQGFQIANTLSGQRLRSWEYVIEDPRDDQLATRLQQLGGAGWELVFARRATTGVGSAALPNYELIFRRESGVATTTFLPTPQAVK